MISMKSMPEPMSSPPSLSNRLESHFLTLAAVAAAAGAGLAEKAEATVVYSGPMNITVPLGSIGMYFNMTTFAHGSYTSGLPLLNLSGSASNGGACATYPSGNTLNRIVGTSTSNAAGLLVGDTISAASIFLTFRGQSGFATSTNWGLGTIGYLGYKFDIGGGNIRYGWTEVQINNSAGGVPMTVLGMAYENSGAAIQAGATGVPAPSAGLAVLALGAAGLSGRRRPGAAAAVRA